jgi:aspartyl/asparaginyl-tRNA synthetase
MITRSAYRAIAIGLVLFGLATIVPSSVLAHEHSALVTLVGCLQQVEIKGRYEFVLGRTRFGPAASVRNPNCAGTEDAVRLEHTKHLDETLIGRWVEITGKLEKYENSHELRELHVESFRAVPVVPPQPRPLPHTASPLPLTGLIGLLLIAGGIVFHLFAQRASGRA